MKITLNKEIAEKVLKIVDKGLVNGLGVAEPGKMCVEAAEKSYRGEHTTVGYIIFENENYIISAASKDADIQNTYFHDASMIMKNVIIRREKIKHHEN